MSSGTVRVASVPSGHPYVEHLSDPSRPDGVVRLPDEPVYGGIPGQWWPPAMLDALWVREHAAMFDVFHVHFGFEGRSAEQLRALVAALHQEGRPLVVTVHDLRNPHVPDPTAHDEALGILLGGAHGVITLTHGAAGEIHRRWARRATVIPHPHVVDIQRMRRARPDHAGFVVGLHAKSERANNASVAVTDALAEAVAALPGSTLRVDVHDDQGGRAVAAALYRRPDVDLRVHARFSDHELWDYIAGLDVSVLPYRFGTHSGWLEACNDLGTAVLAPSCGYYGQQGPCVEFRHDESGLDRRSLTAALRTVYDQRPASQWDPCGRIAQRRDIAAAHLGVYQLALEETSRR